MQPKEELKGYMLASMRQQVKRARRNSLLHTFFTFALAWSFVDLLLDGVGYPLAFLILAGSCIQGVLSLMCWGHYFGMTRTLAHWTEWSNNSHG